MKKMISVFTLCLCLFCLTGCGEPPELKKELEAGFKVVRDEMTYKGNISLSGGELHIEMLEPYTVAGMMFDYTDEGMSIGYADHGTKANCDYIPAGAIPSVLHNTLTYISKAAFLQSEGDTDIYSVTTPYGEATIKAADGIPMSLEDTYSGLCFVLSDHSA